MDEVGEPSVPCARRLFEPVEALGELAHVVSTVRHHESSWLPSIDVLVDDAMEKGIVDVELVHRPAATRRKGEDGADGRGLDDRAVGFTVVDAGSLCETSDNPSRLVPVEGPIFFVLVAKDPLAADDIGAVWLGNEVPCLITNEGIKFGLHRSTPVGVAQSSMNCLGNRREWRCGRDVGVAGVRLVRANPGARRHRVHSWSPSNDWKRRRC